MTYEDFQAEVNTAIAAISAYAQGKITAGFGEINYSLAACECAAEITGADVTFCKMLNREFRNVAAKMIMERAA
jgi:hypothetical protein